ncbi:MAG: type I-F CRISPR-associated endoribonuclease Cas6/Csy4 [Gammaproteobacteria bacterium]|nr:type I-F CRISPR-associated endoribonuclease Cas6/Csy4 [Gammaproteobacteria bacterium]
MKFYIEITLLPGAEIGLHFLWQKVYQQIHLGLVEIQGSSGEVPIGISLPQYNAEKQQLGNKLRLFAKDKQILEKMDVTKWLNRLTDYVHTTQIRGIPENRIAHAKFKRQQVKSSKERLARRKAKRNGIDYEQALVQLKAYDEKRVQTPFINIKSQSTGEQFRLFIEKLPAEKAQEGQFNSYGLSNKATVPWF